MSVLGGTSFYENGNKKYEGDWKNDAYNGEGVLCHSNGKIQYKGQFLNGRYHGMGEKYDESGTF